LVSFVCFVVPPSSSSAAEPTYWGEVRAVLRKHCTVCHNPRQAKEPEVSGGLRLDTYEAVLRWKEKNKELVKPGKSAGSLLIQVVTTTDSEKRMPLGVKPLPGETIALLRRWVDGGAREGVRPKDAGTAAAVIPARRRRKLDVTLATTLVPDRSAFASQPRGPLSLTLPIGPLAPVAALAYSPDGKTLAAGAYGRVTVWDLGAARPARVLSNVLGAVNVLRFSPDGKLLCVGGGQPSAKGDLRLFDTADWKLRATLGGHDDVVASVDFRHDGKKLASASFDRTVRVWDLATLKTERTLTMHSDFVHAIAYSPDGKYLASASKDRAVRLTEADTGKGVFTFADREQDVLAVAYSRDGKGVVASGLEPALSWWNTATGARLRSAGGHRGAVHELTFSRDGKLLASAGEDGTVKLWNGSTGALMRSASAGSLVYACALSPDGKTAAAGSFDGLVRLYDTATGTPRGQLLSVPGAAEKASWLALAPGGYAAAEEALAAQARWRMAGREVPAEAVWKALGKPELVAKALRGEAVPAPVFR
jgi:hypothetical protein